MVPRSSSEIAEVWAWFQRRFFVLTTVGVIGTLCYIFFIVVPRLGISLHGSPMWPSFPAFNLWVLIIHIATAIPPLFIGLIAFSSRARRWSWRVHRWIGTTYCMTIWISAITGGMLAAANEHGILAKMGFGTLAVVWFMTTYWAYTTARAKDFIAHRRWMIRSFAVTLAVVSVRPMFLFPPPFGLELETWYVMVTWLCWVPNLIAGEIYARVTMYSGRLELEKDLKRRERQGTAGQPATSPALPGAATAAG